MVEGQESPSLFAFFRKTLILPDMARVQSVLDDLIEATPALDGEERPAADLWRRVALGLSGSQACEEGGTIPTYALIWKPAFRLKSKERMPLWYTQIIATRAYRLRLSDSPLAMLTVGSIPLIDSLRAAGVASKVQLGAFISSVRLQISRTEKFRIHATLAPQKRQHLTAPGHDWNACLCCLQTHLEL